MRRLVIFFLWFDKSICMQHLRCMREIFLELDTTLNDELVHRGFNEFVSLHAVWVSNKDILNTLRIKCLPLFRGNPGPCTGAEYMEVGDSWFGTAPCLKGGPILNRSMGRSILYVVSTVKCFSPQFVRKILSMQHARRHLLERFIFSLSNLVLLLSVRN